MNQIQPFYTGATGGIKMQVQSDDVIRAKYILAEMELIQENSFKPNRFVSKIDQITSNIPLLNKLNSETRILVIIAILMIVILLPVFLVNI